MSDVKAGRYNAEVIGAEMSMVGTTDPKPVIWVNFRTEDGNISTNLFLTPAAQKYTAEKLQTLGASAAQLREREFYENPGAVLIGAHVQIVTEIKSTESGKPFTEVKYINPLRVKPSTDMIGNVASSMAALLGGPEAGGDDWAAGANPPPERTRW